MKKTLILITFFSSQAYALSADGLMDCTVTGNVVVASEEGKFKTYSSIQGGVKVNEKLILNYQVTNSSFYIELKRDLPGSNIIINAVHSVDNPTTTTEKLQNGGFIIKDSKYNHSTSFLPDYIRIYSFREFFISRYYKNDWHGIYSDVNKMDSSTQTLTLNCRHTNDKMDATFNIFTGYKELK